MRCRRSCSAGVFVFCVSLVLLGATLANAQQEADAPAVQPGPEHALLAKLAGMWEATAHVRMAPDQPAVASQGVETQRLVCGGLWLISNYQGKLAGQSFEGHGTTGYDQKKKSTSAPGSIQ